MSQADKHPMPALDDDEVERLKRRIVKFKKSYSDREKTADRFRKDVEANLSQLMKQNELVPAVLESRLKSLDSTVRKAEGLHHIDDVLDLHDFVGLRLLFLVANEVAKAVELIRGTFDTGLPINKGDQLKFNEFGYRAIHIIARLPKAWLSIPNYSDCGQTPI